MKSLFRFTLFLCSMPIGIFLGITVAPMLLLYNALYGREAGLALADAAGQRLLAITRQIHGLLD